MNINNEVMLAVIALADWNWLTYDKPGIKKDFDIHESDAFAEEHLPILKANGIENATWGSEKINNRMRSVVYIRFNKMTPMAIDAIQSDMDGGFMGIYECTHVNDKHGEWVETIPKEIYIEDNVTGDDIYICPYSVEYEDGWLTLTVIVSRE